MLQGSDVEHASRKREKGHDALQAKSMITFAAAAEQRMCSEQNFTSVASGADDISLDTIKKPS